MIAVKAKLVRRGVCDCGYPAIRETVPLGKLYLVYPATVARGTLNCGGCHKEFPIDVIAAEPEGLMFLGLLELDEGVAA